MHLNGKKIGKCHLMAKKLAKNEQMDRRFMFMKILSAQRVVCPCPGAIYMCMTIIFKHLYSETSWSIKAKLYVEHS